MRSKNSVSRLLIWVFVIVFFLSALRSVVDFTIFPGGYTMFSLITPFIIIGGILFVFALAKSADKNVASKRNQLRDEPNHKYYPHDSSEPYSTKTKSYYSETTKCSECDAVIDKNDKFCRECGAPQKDVVRCPHCGHLNPRTNAICDNCNEYI